MDLFRCPLHYSFGASVSCECHCYKRDSPEPPVLRDEFLCACDKDSLVPESCDSFYSDPFHFIGQPNLDGDPLGHTVSRKCPSIFPEYSDEPNFALPPPGYTPAPAATPSAPVADTPASPRTKEVYTQTTKGSISEDLQIPVPLLSSECEIKPGYLLCRSGPVTTSVHRIPYNSPCSTSRAL